MRLDPVRFGIAFGILYGCIFLAWGLVSALFGWGADLAAMMGEIYPGFGSTVTGALLGIVYGFLVGFVFFGAAAWIYNRLLGPAKSA